MCWWLRADSHSPSIYPHPPHSPPSPILSPLKKDHLKIPGILAVWVAWVSEHLPPATASLEFSQLSEKASLSAAFLKYDGWLRESSL